MGSSPDWGTFDEAVSVRCAIQGTANFRRFSDNILPTDGHAQTDPLRILRSDDILAQRPNRH